MTHHAISLDLIHDAATSANDDTPPDAVITRLQDELAELEQVVTAGVLVTAAFRLKDERGLVITLRKLAAAIDRLEKLRDAA